MNQDMLVTIEDESLDMVAGGARLPIKAVTTALFNGVTGAVKALGEGVAAAGTAVFGFLGDLIKEHTDL